MQPPKPCTFPENDSLPNIVGAITLFLAKFIFNYNYSSIISKEVFACLDIILSIGINIINIARIINFKIPFVKSIETKSIMTFLQDVN